MRPAHTNRIRTVADALTRSPLRNELEAIKTKAVKFTRIAGRPSDCGQNVLWKKKHDKAGCSVFRSVPGTGGGVLRV